MFKNKVDFHCSVNMFWYITMKFIWQQFMHLAWNYSKLSFIKDNHHRWPGARQWRHVRITFHSSNQTYYIFRIIRFEVKQTNNIVALAVFMFILNISVEQTKFQYNGGSISNRNLNITLSIDMYDNGQCKVIHPSSDLHVFWNPRNSKKYMTSLKRYIWRFLSKIECCNVVSEGILKFLPLFTISTLSNNDVIHRVPGNFKCC